MVLAKFNDQIKSLESRTSTKFIKKKNGWNNLPLGSIREESEGNASFLSVGNS